MKRESRGSKRAGVSVGGQFAASERSQASGEGLIEADARDWGDTGISVGSRTPWGDADWVTELAPGIVNVSTPSHGGIKLSPERNKEIPPALRQRSGWYEEDCEASIPMYFMANDVESASRSSADEIRRENARVLRDYYPDQWTAATGEPVALEDSYTLRERDKSARAHNQMAVTSAITAASDPDKVLVTARRAADGREAEYLVDKAEYRAHDRNSGHFIVDPSRHPELPAKEAERKPQNRLVHVPDELPSTLTETARRRITKDLDQRWRTEDGVKSLRQILATEGAEHRSVYVEGEGANLKFRYAVVQADHSSLRVSKATFDYLSEIPDNRTASDLQREDSLRKEAKYQKLVNESTRTGRFGGRMYDQVREAKAEMLASQQTFMDMRARENAERILREGSHEDRIAREREARAERERQATIRDARALVRMRHE